MEREFVIAVYPVKNSKVCLVNHKKLGKWLPPGGHIEEGELPEEAALREVKEETGLEVCLLGKKDGKGEDENVKMLKKPNHIQLEDIKPGHQHIDLVYFAEVLEENEATHAHEHKGIRWFSREELGKENISLNTKYFASRAIESMDQTNSQS